MKEMGEFWNRIGLKKKKLGGEGSLRRTEVIRLL